VIRALAAGCAIAAAAGCVSVEEVPAVWQPAAEVAGVELGPPPAPRPPPAGALRVASWNMEYAADPVGQARALLASPELALADVLLVQEIEVHPGEPSRAERLAAELAMTWFYAPARTEADHTHGLAILSRYPLDGAAVMRLPHVEQPINDRDRIAITAEVVLDPARRLRIVDVHLDTRIGAVDRIRQLHPAVVDHAGPIVAGGDLNTNPWAWVGSVVPLTETQAIVDHDQAAVVDDYMAALGYESAISPDESTKRIPLISMRLDALYAREAAIGAAGVGRDVEGSDHWPIWADVSVE
jgi:endonuclease/exonuclease/phosphatase family metal-dependent hydrolase